MKDTALSRWCRGEFDTEKVYYVYEWYDEEDGHTIYVGKGKGGRYRERGFTKRNKRFGEYIRSHDCKSRILVSGLSEEEAFELEKETISEKREKGECEFNFADGGAISTPNLAGELNPMWGRTHTPEVRERLSVVNSDGRHKGENNSQYGVHLRDRMSEEQYQHWIAAHKEKYQGAGNPKARKVNMRCADTGEVYKTFDCIKDCTLFLQKFFPELSNRKYDNFRRFPEVHCTPQKAYKNYYFEIIKPNKDNTVPSSETGEGVTTTESVLVEKNNEE